MYRTLPDLVDSFVDKANQTVSFKSQDVSWSPAVLFSTAATWAQFLRELNVQPGDRVGIYLRKSLEEIGSIIAITQVGGVFVCIHPSNRLQQLQHIINDCDIQVLVTSRERLKSLGAAVSELRVKHLVVTDDFAGLEAPGLLHTLKDSEGLPQLRPELRPRRLDDDFATVIYTSGSTGKPKGIIQTHGNLVEGAEIVSHYVKNVADDRVLSLLPFSFDYGLNQLLSALHVGFSLVLQDYLFPFDALKTLEKENITGLAGVPTIWLDLLGVLEKRPEMALPHLRYITNSGGKLYSSTVQRLKARLPNTDIYLMYGLTEAFRSTYLPPDQVNKRADSIGKAIPNVSIHVINEEGKECAPGEAGELIHRGALIAKGYWGDPEKTARVYRPNPLLPPHLQFTETVVYSGDLVRKDEEGYLYFIGRRDNMIKSSGHRISPDEITTVLLRMQGVQNAAVIGIEDEHRGYKIAAFLQLDDISSITQQDCVQFVKKFLPPHMIPSIIKCMRKFPQNANGKVDLIELKKQVTDVNDPL